MYVAKKVIGEDRKNLTPFDHIRAIDHSMHSAQNWGLEKYVPAQRLLPTEPLTLVPPQHAKRPILTFKMDQAHSGFAGAWFLLEVPGLRARCSWDGPHRKWNDAKNAAAAAGLKGALLTN
mgnify:CR=1 FL=1